MAFKASTTPAARAATPRADAPDVIPFPIPSPGPVGPDVRARIEAAIERLMALLDELDGEADFEPMLATTVAEDCRGVYGPTDDREEEDDFEHQMTDDNGVADLGGLLEQGLRLSYEHVE